MPSNPILKHPAHDPPAQIIQRRRRRNTPRPAKDQRRTQILQRTSRPAPCPKEEDHRRQRAHGEKPEQRAVDLAGREDARGPQQAPDHAGGEEDLTAGADEFRGLVRRAHLWDRGEGDVQDGDLDEAGEEGGGYLGGEHVPGWDLHVVAAVGRRR